MTAPAVAARRLLISFLLGAGLGLGYDFLRPFRHRFPKLGDLLFLAAAFQGWLQLCFRFCRGDLRMGYYFGLISGILVWELTVSRPLRPLFLTVWQVIARFLALILLPLKKNLVFFKNFVCICRKMGYNKV